MGRASEGSPGGRHGRFVLYANRQHGRPIEEVANKKLGLTLFLHPRPVPDVHDVPGHLIEPLQVVEVEGPRDFYRQLCLALGLKPSATAAAVFFSVTTNIEELGHERVHPVFLLDEAHLLHQDVIDHLHILLNYQWDSRALLSLVLVGLPELEDRLSRRHHRSLYSRLHTRLRIDPLTPEDTAEYLRVRLHRAGCERELFGSDAVAMLHEAASGAHRDIDRLATAALKEAARRKKKLVERDVLARVLDASSEAA